MSYQEAPATRMLATNCVCCGRPLVDACSVELGIGPDCRNGIFPEGVDEEDRMCANGLVFKASKAAQNGAAEDVVGFADEIRKLGFEGLAAKVERRFRDGVVKGVRDADIIIDEDGEALVVRTPYRRGAAKDFVSAWRSIPGRRWDGSANRVPKAQRKALWSLLRKFFPGKWGAGPKGAFRVPKGPKEETQLEMDFEA